MKARLLWIMVFAVGLLIGGKNVFADGENVVASKSKSWTLSGRVQLQHLYSDQFTSDSEVTNNGFRMRRVRLQAKANVTSFITGNIQFEVRDNSPNLKDAEAIVKLFSNYYFRVGQYKVPVWREEFMRSSGNLLLVERSAPSGVLLLTLLSGRQVGLEIGGKPSKQFSFAFNYSNGAGEGFHELTRKKSLNQNNGKMFSGRIDFYSGKTLGIGLSGAANNLGNKIALFDSTGAKVGTSDNTGTNSVIAPDIGIYVGGLEVESGVAFGSITKHYLKTKEDIKFTAFDITGRYTKKLQKASESLGGLDSWELAAGFSYIDNDSEEAAKADEEFEKRFALRFGPAIYFGKRTRLQVNLEFVDFDKETIDSITRIRSQLTLNL